MRDSRHTWPRRADIVGVALLTVVVVVIWFFGGTALGIEQWKVSRALLTALTAIAMISALLAARAASGRLRFAWLAFAVGRVGWVIGELIWDQAAFVRHRFTFPSAADAAFLLWTVSACVGLALYPSARSARVRIAQLLDGLIVATSLFIVLWLAYLGHVFADGSPGAATFVLALGYPISDIMILTAAAIVLIRSGSAERPSLALVAGGVICITFADGGFAYLMAKGQYGLTHPIDIGWIVGLVLITLAAGFSRFESVASRPNIGQVTPPSWAAMWLPFGPLFLAGMVTFLVPERVMQAGPVRSACVVLLVAVVSRQLIAASENRRLLSMVSQQALHDPLTGAANRALFGMQLDQALAHLPDGRYSVGVIILDLNDFKPVNDTLGHAGGDRLLIDVAYRLKRRVSRGTVARLGGDEFAVLIEDTADQIDATARHLMDIFVEPFVIDGSEVLIDASMGVAVASCSESCVSAEDLVKRADLAMYAGKQSCERSPQWFKPGSTGTTSRENVAVRLERLTRHTENVRLVHELRRSIDNDELTLAYQPKYDLVTMRIVGVEALVRWPHPSLGVIAPRQFLPLVRRNGLVRQVTEFVVETAVRDAGRWRCEWQDVPVSINMFVPLFRDPTVVDMVLGHMTRGGLAAGSLAVETTEDLLLDDHSAARRIMAALRDSGIRVVVDDFGKGHVALSYLRDLPIDEVKLDSSLITPVLTDPRAAVLAQAVIGLVQGLGLTAVAKGIESREVATRLRDYGCDIGQGFFFSPPVDLDHLLLLPAIYSATPQ